MPGWETHARAKVTRTLCVCILGLGQERNQPWFLGSRESKVWEPEPLNRSEEGPWSQGPNPSLEKGVPKLPVLADILSAWNLLLGSGNKGGAR